ncbi:MAG: tripartite tricarboxylate transporter TctB family protein [Paracoccaceae bacterium]
MTTRTAEGLMAAALLVLAIGLMIKSADLNIGWVRGRGPGSGFWPFWLSALLAVAAIATCVRWAMNATPESRTSAPYIDADTVVLVLVTAVALTLMIALIQVIGMYLSFMLFLLFYLKVIGRHSWSETAVFLMAVPTFIYLLFEVALTKYLPKGWSDFEEAFLVIDNVRYDIQYGPNPGLVMLGLALYVALAVVVGSWASRRGHNGVLAFVVSVPITPILGAALYYRLGRRDGARPETGRIAS